MNYIELGKQLVFNVHHINFWTYPGLEMPSFKKYFRFFIFYFYFILFFFLDFLF